MVLRLLRNNFSFWNANFVSATMFSRKGKQRNINSKHSVHATMVVYHLHQKPIWFQTVQMERKMSIGKSRSEHALSISRKIGKNRKYIVQGLERDGNPSKMWMERNKPVEKSQPVKEDNVFKHTDFSGNFPIGSTKNMCSIYFLSGITGIFMSMVNNQCFLVCPGLNDVVLPTMLY